MLRTTLRNLAARKLRLLTTSVAVILGVAFMVGTLVLTDTIGRTFDNLFADVNAGTDAYVRGNAEVDGRMGDLRPRLDQSLVATVGSVDGVAAVAPRVQGYTQILDREGEPMGHPNMGAPTYGANWITTSHLNPFRIAEGRAPERSGEMVIDRASATLAGYDVGDTAGFITRTGRHDAIVVGIATFGEADSPGGASFALFTTTVAQELVTERGKVDGIAVAADPGVAQAAVVERIADVLSDDVEVLSGEALTAESRDDLQESLSFFNVFLMTFAFIALFVGSFIIYNTFSILVAQRGKEMALLRALGAGRRQVLTSVLLEALAVGLAASLGGIVVGVGVAGGLKALLAGMGIDIPAGGLVVTGSTVTTSLIAGVVVCVVSAVFPARKASLTPPVAAMRETAFEIARNGRPPGEGGGLRAESLPDPPLRLERWPDPDPARYRALFRRVGAPWLWYSRLVMDDERLRREMAEVHAVVDADGAEAGLLELDFRTAGECLIRFLGLVPELAGKGHGGWLFAQALALAWRPGVRRVHVNTCTLDHPAALKAYLKAGFKAYRRAFESFPDPRLAGLLPEDVAPQIPSIGGGTGG